MSYTDKLDALRRLVSAALVDTLSRDGARVIGFDIAFSEPDENSQVALIDQLARRVDALAIRDQRLADFTTRLDAAEKRWLAAMAPYKGTKVVTYHRSFPNFAERYGLDIVGYVEPRPGIPPSPSHTLELIKAVKEQNVKIILVEPYFDLKTPNSIAAATGGQVLVMLPSVGGQKEVTDYFKLFDYDLSLLMKTLQASR